MYNFLQKLKGARKADDEDTKYVEKELLRNMKYSIERIKNFNCIKEIETVIKTALAVIR